VDLLAYFFKELWHLELTVLFQVGFQMEPMMDYPKLDLSLLSVKHKVQNIRELMAFRVAGPPGNRRVSFAFALLRTAVGVGASLSQVVAGSIVHHSNFNAGILFLTAIAVIALLLLAFFMPETRNRRATEPCAMFQGGW